MSSFHVNIVYDGMDPKAPYEAVAVTQGTQEAMRWSTGNPVADWASFMDWAKGGHTVYFGSSLSHFVFDNDDYTFVMAEDCCEHLVESSFETASKRSLSEADGDYDLVPLDEIEAYRASVNERFSIGSGKLRPLP